MLRESIGGDAQRRECPTATVRAAEPLGFDPALWARLADLGKAVEANGTGLGLAITRKLIEGHGGSIEIESKEGAGTTLVITLPRERVR